MLALGVVLYGNRYGLPLPLSTVASDLLTMAGSVVLILVSTCPLRTSRTLQVLQQPVLLYLGKVSFGLYLLHLPVLLLLASWLSPTWPLPVTCVLALGVSVGLADVLHRGVERPGIAWGRALSRWWRVAPDARRAPGIS